MADPIKLIYARRQAALDKELLNYKMPKMNFRASGIGDCKTRQYYHFSGFIPAVNTGRLQDYGDDGNMHHDKVRHILRDAGVKLGGLTFNHDGTVIENFSKKIKVKYQELEFQVSMRLDGFIYMSNRKHVLEIKSLGNWKFQPLQTAWRKADMSEAALLGWLREHRADILYQMHACMVGAKLSRAYLLFKDRDGCGIGLHPKKGVEGIIGGPVVLFDDGIWEEAKARMATVVRAVAAGAPPPPEHESDAYICKTCPYLHLCHDAERRQRTKTMPILFHPQLGTKLHVRDL